MTQHPGRRQVAGGLAVGCSLAAAAAPAWFGLHARPVAATQVGFTVSGLSAVISAGLMLLRGVLLRRHGGLDLWRGFFGLAVLVWGIGQLLLAGQAVLGDLGYPALGDLVSAGAAPLALAGLMQVPRLSVSPWPGVRLALDSIILGLAATFAVWRIVLVQPGSALTGGDLATMSFVIGDTSVLSLVLLAAIRDVRARLTALVLGLTAHVVADLLTMLASGAQPRAEPWVASALWCLGWPLVAGGVLRYRPNWSARGDTDGAEQDGREARASRSSTIIAAVLVVIAMLLGQAPLSESGGRLLLLLFVVGFTFRELVGTALRVQLTVRLRGQAYRDPLTELANRHALLERLAELPTDQPRLVVAFDLDGFKQVNELLGQQAGDQLLVAVADGLAAARPPTALVARTGGDEFAVLVKHDAANLLEDGRQLAERLREQLRGVLDRHAAGLDLSASVGVGQTLAESAVALRAAKANGRNGVQVYAGAVADAHERRLVLERRLRHAVDSGAVVSHVQPIVDLASRRLTGFEALARWTDGVLGPVSPAEFIPLAEQTGLVVRLGEQLIAGALAEATERGLFAAGLKLSVNASPVQLRVPGFARLMRQHVDRYQVPPGQLVVEVTESILVTEDDPAVRTLDQLVESGIGIAIDDFGTGYSALGYLRRLPVAVLKVDQSLTRALSAERRSQAIVQGMVKLAHRMGIGVVMEGIEDEPMAAACRAVGADRGQGWLFGRPVPWADAAELIAGVFATTRIGQPVAPSGQPAAPSQRSVLAGPGRRSPTAR